MATNEPHWRELPDQEDRVVLCTGIANAILQQWGLGHGDRFEGDPLERQFINALDSLVLGLYAKKYQVALEEENAALREEIKELRAELHRIDGRPSERGRNRRRLRN